MPDLICALKLLVADPTLMITHGWVLSVGNKVWWEYKGESSYGRSLLKERAWVFYG